VHIFINHISSHKLMILH